MLRMNLAGFYYKRAMSDADRFCFSLHARMRRSSFFEYLVRARIPVASRISVDGSGVPIGGGPTFGPRSRLKPVAVKDSVKSVAGAKPLTSTVTPELLLRPSRVSVA